MKMFYSPSKGAMLNDVVYRNSLPADAVEIPADRVDEILAGLGLQQTLTIGEGGQLILVDPAPFVPVPDPPADVERIWRDNELSSVIWLRERHRDQTEIAADTTLTTEQFAELLLYIQALRDWPQSPNFPDRSHRPVAPEWLSDQLQ